MQSYTLNGKEVVPVEWYEGAIRCYINGERWLYFTLPGAINHGIELPPGSYSIIGIGKDMTEEQWQELVEFYTEDSRGQITHWTEWKDYMGKENYDNAKSSGLSWLRSNNIPETSLLILKNK